jgi:spore germination protein YaaH
MRKIWRKFGAILLTASIAAAPQVSAAQTAKPQVNIVLDGYPLPFAVEPIIVNGTTMVPFRTISEALGITVEWDQATKTITATDAHTSEKKVVKLTLNKENANVNGEEVRLAVAPMLSKQSTLIPLSFFSQQFGAAVGWDQTTKTVSIRSPKQDIHTLAFYAISSFSEAKYIPAFDSVAFGWSRIDREGNLTLQGKDFYWPKPAGEITPESIVRSAAEQGTSPSLMVFATDGNLELSGILENEEKREATAKQIADLAIEKGFEGIVLDFEGLGLTGDPAAVREEYNAFVRLVKEAVLPHGIRISLALHPLNSSYRGYDYKTLGGLADELIIMAYAYGDETGPEPAKRVDEAVRLALKEVSKEKLLLGISMGSENAASLHVKLGLAKRYGLKGIALWRLGLLGEDAYKELTRNIVLN